jgi:hypothetical protein
VKGKHLIVFYQRLLERTDVLINIIAATSKDSQVIQLAGTGTGDVGAGGGTVVSSE